MIANDLYNLLQMFNRDIYIYIHTTTYTHTLLIYNRFYLIIIYTSWNFVWNKYCQLLIKRLKDSKTEFF